MISILGYTQKPRAREIGISFEGTTGKFNAITDVKGVEVGYSTIISGQGKNVCGKGPVPNGRPSTLPKGRNNNPVYANRYSLNGNGEMTGTFPNHKNKRLDVYGTTVRATEEVITNAMVAAETMEDGNKAYALSHKKVIEVLKK
jgi:L-aminopeptidase/D-esterase-like protein